MEPTYPQSQVNIPPAGPTTTDPKPEPEPEPETAAAMAGRWNFIITQRFQHILDKSSPHILYRWIGLSILALIYAVRVYFLQGFYLVSYALGIYLLNLLIGFLSPKVDPTLLDDGTGIGTDPGPALPVRASDEFRPFVRRLPEFLFWYSITKAFCIVFVMTFFPVFDVPVFWPILLFYWVLLVAITLRKQIQHMIKYKYVPFTIGKKRYEKKRPGAEENASLVRD